VAIEEVGIFFPSVKQLNTRAELMACRECYRSCLMKRDYVSKKENKLLEICIELLFGEIGTPFLF